MEIDQDTWLVINNVAHKLYCEARMYNGSLWVSVTRNYSITDNIDRPKIARCIEALKEAIPHLEEQVKLVNTCSPISVSSVRS